MPAVLAVLVFVAGCAGQLDRSFGDAGAARFPFSSTGRTQFTLAPTDHGAVVFTGLDEQPVARLSTDGVVDPAWGEVPAGTFLNVTRVRRDRNRFLVIGNPPGPTGTRLVRITAGGALDRSFGGGDGIADIDSRYSADVIPLPHGGYLGLGDNNGTSVPPLGPLVAYRLSDDGSVLGTTNIDVHIDPLSESRTPPGFLGWFLSLSLAPLANGAVAMVHLDAVGRDGGAVFYGTTALVDFDAAGMLGAPWNTQGITPPALRTNEGIYEEQTSVTGLSGGLRLLATTLTGTSGTTTSIALPGSWTTTTRSPFATNLAINAVLPCIERGRVLVGGAAADKNSQSHALIASYSLASGALDTSFGGGGYVDVPFAAGRRTADDVRALASSGPDCEKFYALAVRYSDDGGPQVNRFWGPARH